MTDKEVEKQYGSFSKFSVTLPFWIDNLPCCHRSQRIDTASAQEIDHNYVFVKWSVRYSLPVGEIDGTDQCQGSFICQKSCKNWV